jgi:hypothetical protein
MVTSTVLEEMLIAGRGGGGGVRGAQHPLPEAGHTQPERHQLVGRQLCRRLPRGGL